MPKEWGTKVPNINLFERAAPPNHQELFENLKNLGKNWSYVSYCGVVKQLKGIFVDLGPVANKGVPMLGIKGTKDFYNPLKALDVDKADTLVKAIVAKVEAGQPIVEQDAIALFATCETS